MNNKENKDLKYLGTESDSVSRKAIDKLVSELKDKEGFDETMKSTWDEFVEGKRVVDKDLSYVLEKIHQNISSRETKLKVRFLNNYSKVAAVLFIPLMVFGAYMFLKFQNSNQQLASNSLIEVHAPSNSRVKCVLPDSSIVWLNSASSISYSPSFNSERKIDLKGKAYFEVVHKISNKPFTVNFQNGQVDVLGTKFAISSRNNGDFNVVLLEGSIDAKLKRKSMKEKSVLLKPNTMLVSSTEGNVVKKVNAKNLVAWIHGKLVFRNTPVKYVFSRISDFYNVPLEIEDTSLLKLTYWGTFKDESLEDVLNLMSMTLPFEYEVVERVKNEDNTFSEKKIIIKKKN